MYLFFFTDVAGMLPLPRTNQVVFEYSSGRAVPRLKEPHHLYGLSGNVSQTLPRWPLECEVILGEVFHVGESLQAIII